MNRIEDALHELPDTLDVTPRGDLVTSVRRRHARRVVRRRTGIAAVTVGATALAAVPGVLITRSSGRSDGASGLAGGTLGTVLTVASLDARLASLAAAAPPDEPRPATGFAYTRTRAIWTSSIGLPVHGAMASTDASAPSVAEGKAAGQLLPAGEEKLRQPPAGEDLFTYGDPKEREIWLDPWGNGYLKSMPLPPMFFHPGDEQRYAELGLADNRGMDMPLGNESGGKVANPSFTADLPTDREGMRTLLRKIAADRQPAANALFTAGRDLLRESILPLRVRVAVYRALLSVPGVTIANAVADYDGRTGAGIGLVDAERKTLEQIIVDPGTGTQLGERDSLAAPTEIGPAGTVVGHTAVLQSGYVDAIKVRPGS